MLLTIFDDMRPLLIHVVVFVVSKVHLLVLSEADGVLVPQVDVQRVEAEQHQLRAQTTSITKVELKSIDRYLFIDYCLALKWSFTHK